MKIIVEFVGGCLDGNRVEGSADSAGDVDRIDYAAYCFHLTEGGELGQRFWVVSDSTRKALRKPCKDLELSTTLACRRHYYEIVSRNEQDDRVLLRARFVVSVQLALESGDSTASSCGRCFNHPPQTVS